MDVIRFAYNVQATITNVAIENTLLAGCGRRVLADINNQTRAAFLTDTGCIGEKTFAVIGNGHRPVPTAVHRAGQKTGN